MNTNEVVCILIIALWIFLSVLLLIFNHVAHKKQTPKKKDNE